MKKLLVFFILLAVSLNSYTQIRFPDSVKTAKQKVKFLIKLADSNIKQDSAIYFSDKAIEYAKKCACDTLAFNAQFNKVVFLYNAGKSKKAILELKALDSLLKITPNNFYKYKTTYQFSQIYAYSVDKPDAALEYGKKALKIASKMKDSLLIADSYYILSYIYTNVNMDSISKKHLLKALDICKKQKIKTNLLERVYFGLMNASKTEAELNKYGNECLKLIKNNPIYTAYYYVQKGNVLREQLKEYPKAKKNLLIGLKLCKELNYKVMYDFALIELGQVENELKNYPQAVIYFKDALKTKDANLNNSLTINEGLSFAHSKLKHYKKANFYKDTLLKLKDSVIKNKASAEFAKYNVTLATIKKDKEIAKQQLEIARQKNNKNKLIIGSLLLLLLLYSIFQWIYNKQKQKKITTENELQKELEINELRTKFLGNIAHEIRTPLTLITGNLELAKENINTKDKAVQNIDVALTNSKKVVDDANEILELLKFEKSKITINQNVINLDTTLKRIFYSFKSLAELKKIDLKYQSVLPANFQIKTDVQKVEKILNNLISNALKYSPSNSEIIFYANVIDENLVVKVTDFGQGIHFDETEKIFQRFYQASNSQSVGGIGIGLSLAKEFAELLHGNLSVKSELTKGSTFTFTLPITKVSEQNIETSKDLDLINRKDEQNLKTQQTTKQQSSKNKNKPNILIVEDNPEMNNYLVEILSNNYNCFSAYDGLEALEKLTERSFDLITSDIMMPNLNGFEFREKLNEIEKFSNIPFILISAKTLTEDKIKGFKLGIDDYVIKPFNKNELIARIENLLINKNAREEWTITNKTLISTEENSDKKLLKKIESSILENISDENFKIDDLAKSVGYSQRQLTRILKQYTGMSPVKFILEIRLQKAYANLQNKTFFALSEIRYDVGITSASYFNKKFKERFGITPNSLL